MKKLVLLTACISVLGWTLRCEHDDDDDNEEVDAHSEEIQNRGIFENRLWVDHYPENSADVVHVFALIDGGLGAYGQFSEHVQYQENFFWKPTDLSAYHMRFPHRKTETRMTAQVWECDEEPWELCAEVDIDEFGNKRQFYSRWDLIIESTSSLPQQAQFELLLVPLDAQ